MFKLFVVVFAALLAVVAAKPGLVSSYVAAPAVAYTGYSGYAAPHAYSAGYGYGYAAPYAYSGHYGYGYAASPYHYY